MRSLAGLPSPQHSQARECQLTQAVACSQGCSDLAARSMLSSCLVAAQVPVVPITLLGTGAIMPSQQEHKMYPGHVHVIIHPPVQPAAADAMLQAARQAIASGMPAELR